MAQDARGCKMAFRAMRSPASSRLTSQPQLPSALPPREKSIVKKEGGKTRTKPSSQTRAKNKNKKQKAVPVPKENEHELPDDEDVETEGQTRTKPKKRVRKSILASPVCSSARRGSSKRKREDEEANGEEDEVSISNGSDHGLPDEDADKERYEPAEEEERMSHEIPPIPELATDKERNAPAENEERMRDAIPPIPEIATGLGNESLTAVADNQITSSDILCSRGNKAWNHLGNIDYRSLVEEYKRTYRAAGRTEKKEIVTEIIAKTKQNGGRFLRKGLYGKTGFWFVISDKAAEEKVCQAFSRFRHERYEEHKPSTPKPKEEKKRIYKPRKSRWTGYDTDDEDVEDLMPTITRKTEKGGYAHTKKSRARIARANKGNTPWNKVCQ